MNTPRKISDPLPSICQKLLKSVEICLSSHKTNMHFFETRCLRNRRYHRRSMSEASPTINARQRSADC